MKKNILSYFLLILFLCQPLTNVYAIEINSNLPQPSNDINTSNTSFVKINDTVTIDSDIILTLYLDNIEYNNFTFKLYSNNSLEEVNTNDIDLQNFNNEEISFDYCINCSSLKTITLNYKLPTTVEIGNQITFNVQLINKENPLEWQYYRTTVQVIDKVKEEKTEKEKTDFSKGSGISFSNNLSTP